LTLALAALQDLSQLLQGILQAHLRHHGLAAHASPCFGLAGNLLTVGLLEKGGKRRTIAIARRVDRKILRLID